MKQIGQVIGLWILLYASPSLSVSIEDLAHRPRIADVKISPTGEYLAVRIFRNGKHQLVFLDRKALSTVGGVGFSGKNEVGYFQWANHERVVIQIYETSEYDRQPKYYGELYAANYDGSKGELIFGYRAGEMQTGSLIQKKDSERAWAEIIDVLPQDTRNILISSTRMTRADNRPPRAQLLDIYKGLDGRTLKVSTYPQSEFYTDDQGKLRVIVGYREDQSIHIQSLPDISGDWTELEMDKLGANFRPLAISHDGKAMLTLDDTGQDKLGLHKMSLDGSAYENIYTNDRVNVTSVTKTTDHRGVYAMRIDDGYPRYLLFSKTYPEARLFKSLLSTFEGRLVSITSRSRDGRFWVIKTEADTDPGSYLLYDQQEQKLSLLFRAKEKVGREELAPMEPISFESFDGHEITGYFTAATTDKSEPAPLVVLVHGGPRSRDYWGFNPEVQILATQGYSVLQINYRGSSGFGQKFMKAGNRHWGDSVQRDIISGTKWAVDTGRAENGRICIMGASFGGYSAMQSAILEPDLYSCVIASSGVYNLQMLYTAGDIEYSYMGESYLEEAVGRDEKELHRFSPVYNAEKLKAPVLLAHGGKDKRTPLEQAESMENGLKNHEKEYVTFIESTEGHGFYDDENRSKYYQQVIDFLGKHLPNEHQKQRPKG